LIFKLGLVIEFVVAAGVLIALIFGLGFVLRLELILLLLEMVLMLTGFEFELALVVVCVGAFVFCISFRIKSNKESALMTLELE